MSNLAPRNQPGWSGQNWYETSGLKVPTIAVIEPASESYDDYHERKKREQDAERLPFGFSRALGGAAPVSSSAVISLPVRPTGVIPCRATLLGAELCPDVHRIGRVFEPIRSLTGQQSPFPSPRPESR